MIMTEIQSPSSTDNRPEYNTWNPESKTVLIALHGAKLTAARIFLWFFF